MKKIFLGGSRKIGKLNNKIRERIDNIINKGFTILIGDAYGADRAIQKYLHEKNYQHVIVFCMDDTCRNNEGEWESNAVYSDKKEKNFSYYSQKDKLMSEKADYGLMLWDGKSKGTLHNILNLLERKKTVLTYFSPEKSFYTIKDYNKLGILLNKCDKESIRKFEKYLNLHERLYNNQLQLKLA